MRAGYVWTHQLSNILEFAIRPLGDTVWVSTSESYRLLEVLGGLDMNAWIVGRRSEPLHIWATWCMGRQGIEPITGLPRLLMDLIARVSRGEDASDELGQFIALLPDQKTQTEYVWRCFAITALLCVESRHWPSRGVGDLTLELLEALRYLNTTSSGLDNYHALGWPAFTLGIHIQDNSRGGMALVDSILSSLFDRPDDGWRHPGGSIRSLMSRFWEERNEIGQEIAYRNLQSLAVEIGLW